MLKLAVSVDVNEDIIKTIKCSALFQRGRTCGIWANSVCQGCCRSEENEYIVVSEGIREAI